MRIHAITDRFVIYITDDGRIVSQPISQGARDVLEWHARNVPVNDN